MRKLLGAEFRGVVRRREELFYKFAGGRTVRQKVTVGAEQDGQVEIRQAVQDGDTLIVDQLILLKPNTRVRLLRPARWKRKIEAPS